MAPLKHLLVTCLASALATSCDAGDSCETGDQTALLQSHLSRKSDLSLSQHSAQSAAFFPKLANLNDPHTRKSALLEIEKTAVKLASMDRTEATPVVIEVCTETAELLNTTVLYAIIEEDAADRASLNAAYGEFAQWEAQAAEINATLAAAEAVVTQRAMALSNCYTRETETCVNETICTEEESAHCPIVTILEEQLQRIDEEIHNQWCESGQIRTSTEFRTTTIVSFREYMRVYTELEAAMAGCDQWETHCETTLTTYIETATECNTKMAELQMGSCEYHHVAAGALNAYQQGFRQTLAFYNDIVARVMIEEADRKVEWDVLTRVICLLLTLTNEEDGVVSSAETEARIQRCWDDDVDVSHLDIDYRDPPPEVGIPDLPPLPCTAEYDEHYHTDTPEACSALETTHNTQATSECNCLADEIANQGIVLGHFLMVDPAVPMTVSDGQWTVDMDGQTYVGQLSSVHSDLTAFADLSESMLTDDQTEEFEADGTTPNVDYTGPISQVAWAYPSQSAIFQGGMSLGQRFAQNGGMVFMNAAGQVIDVRQIASSSGPLGQPVTATLSFSSAEEITDAQAAAACPYMHDISESGRYYAQGARRYCWAWTPSLPDKCSNGCFIFEAVVAGGTTKLVFPLIEGMHLAARETAQPTTQPAR